MPTTFYILMGIYPTDTDPGYEPYGLSASGCWYTLDRGHALQQAETLTATPNIPGARFEVQAITILNGKTVPEAVEAIIDMWYKTLADRDRLERRRARV